MIYLTFDSNIWIYSLDESWQIENQLDYLEPWIQKGEVKLLLPKMIIAEWSKHEKEQVEEREKKLREFFGMAEEILPSAFFSEYKEPATQRKIIDDQLNRANKLILQCEIIPDYSEVKDRIVIDGITRKAPLHRKSNIADAIIVFSLIHYAERNQGHHYFFISNNTEDFYQKSNGTKEIHQDLKADFNSNNIQSFTTLNQLIFFLKTAHGLNVDENIILNRKERIRNKIKEKVYNPEYDKLIESGENSYIQNINTIEFILKETKPTKEQVIFVLALMDSDGAYERDFYKRLSKASWFEILNRKGVFKPENNPSPVQVKEGIRIPFWEPLRYLERLSLQIKNGEKHELIDSIITIINNASKNPVDNFQTWYVFIKIIINLPNEKISIELLNLIPVWLSDDVDTMIQSSEICNKLLPKFLNDHPTFDDNAKAEIILKHLFSIEKCLVLKSKKPRRYESSYRSRFYMPELKDILIEKEYVKTIVAKSSNRIIFDLAENIRILRFDFPEGIRITFKLQETKYNIKSNIENDNLDIVISEENHHGKIIGSALFEKFAYCTDQQIRNFYISTLSEFGIQYEENEDNEFNFEMLINALTNGSYYYFPDDLISKLNDPFQHGDSVIEVFSLIFRDMLNEKVKQNSETGISLLQLFAFDNKYRLSFFRRVVLFVIGDNWHVCKQLFWEIVKDNDPMHIFSKHSFRKDLYELLNKNQALLIKKEIDVIQKIIDKGPRLGMDNGDPKYFRYWQLGWFSALRNISPFKEKYEEFSQSENMTNENYENLGNLTYTSGSISPYNEKELLEWSNAQIVEFIHNFRPKGSSEEYTIEGFANAINLAVQNEPKKFSDEIDLYKDIPFIYAYQISEGYREAWRNKKLFNWEKVLNFFKMYISDVKFTSGELSLKYDGWGVTSDWVVGSVGNLLTEGMESDSNSIDLSLLPIVKNIIEILISSLKKIDDFGKTKMDYPTHTLNSAAGKTMKALLDYSLMRARNLIPEGNLPRWEQGIKEMLEETLRNGIIDGFILIGWHFQKFYYLDQEWIINKVKEFYIVEDKVWLAFLNGFALGNPPFNKDIYQLFFPHYERAIINDVQIKIFYNHGIIRHIVSFYFWGFEDLQTEGLLLKLINKSSHKNMLELVTFVGRQEKYLKSLNSVEAKDLELAILNLWNLLVRKYENAKGQEEQKVLIELSNLLVFFSELNEALTSLVIKSNIISEQHFRSHNLLENLIRLKERGHLEETGKFIGEILSSLKLAPYVSAVDKKHIIDLVVFLYEKGKKQTASAFCNKMAWQGHEFLIEIHNKYQ